MEEWCIAHRLTGGTQANWHEMMRKSYQHAFHLEVRIGIDVEILSKLLNLFLLFNILVALFKLYILLRAMHLSNRMRLCRRQHS